MHSRRQPAGPGQESVWDYPRPPRIEKCPLHVRIEVEGFSIADSVRAIRVLETSHPPTIYVPPEDVQGAMLRPNGRRSFCEWKGEAEYLDLVLPKRTIECAAWRYPEPTARFAELKDCLAFYPSKMDACFLGPERVQAQPGDFYGGWITSHLVGPFKGGPGTQGW